MSFYGIGTFWTGFTIVAFFSGDSRVYYSLSFYFNPISSTLYFSYDVKMLVSSPKCLWTVSPVQPYCLELWGSRWVQSRFYLWLHYIKLTFGCIAKLLDRISAVPILLKDIFYVYILGVIEFILIFLILLLKLVFLLALFYLFPLLLFLPLLRQYLLRLFDVIFDLLSNNIKNYFVFYCNPK